MITIGEAYKIVEREKPDRAIAYGYNYKDKYVFETVILGSKEPLFDSFFAVDKNDGSVYAYSPMSDDEFASNMGKYLIDLTPYR